MKEELWAEYLTNSTDFDAVAGLEEIWRTEPTRFISLYFESMPKRIKTVIAVESGNTKY